MAFKLNPAFLPLLARSEGVGEATEDAAKEIAERVREFAPIFASYYVENIETERFEEDGKKGTRVIANDPTGAATLIEFGSVNNPAFAPLRRGTEAVLGKLTDRDT